MLILRAPVSAIMGDQIFLEICVDSVESARAAQSGGASRIELCSDLMEGGITPSLGLIEAVRASVRIDLHVIIRPRGGDFCYSNESFDVMHREIELARNAGVDGIVLGILDTTGHVDTSRTSELVQFARPLSVTFHRAFDMTPDLACAMRDVCTTGIDRILTSGGSPSCSEGLETLATLVESSQGLVRIIAARDIRAHNVRTVVERTGVREIHAGPSRVASSPMSYRNAKICLGKTAGCEYQRVQVFEQDVRAIVRSISGE